MTFADAVDSIVNSSYNDATKRPSMGGYVFRSAVSTTEGTEGDYTLTFRKRANSGDVPVDYTYSFDASAGTWTAPSTKPDFTGELLGELLGTDWMIGKKEDFENARIPSSGDEW